MGAGGEVKHAVFVKFKEGVVADDIIKAMQDLVSAIELVLSFEWGEDVESHETLRQGFTHAFLLTFRSQEDLASFQAHPDHVQFSATFLAAIEKIVVLDFPSVVVKPNKVNTELQIDENNKATPPPPPAAAAPQDGKAVA